MSEATVRPHPAAGLRVLVINNYPLEQVWAEVKRGEKPDHHLFGLNHLADLGLQIQVVPAAAEERWRRSDRLLRASRLPFPLGRLGRQMAALRWAEPVDVILSACEMETNLLALRRSFGVTSPPLVVIQHHPLNRGRLARLRAPYYRRIFRGIDATLTLSRRVADEINAEFHPRRPARPLAWGADAKFYPTPGGPGQGSVAVGRTGRDFTSYGLAATRAGTPARIICPSWEADPEFAQFGPNVRVQVLPESGLLPYPALFEAFCEARVLAIPLDDYGDALAGLTSLLDAIALGRPVVMTRNPYLDLDIEALGFGRWVAPRDVAGWAEALRWFEDHPAEAAAMGQRARALHLAGFDSAHFGRDLADVLADVCGRGRKED